LINGKKKIFLLVFFVIKAIFYKVNKVAVAIDSGKWQWQLTVSIDKWQLTTSASNQQTIMHGSSVN
jgi:hypothetical protein